MFNRVIGQQDIKDLLLDYARTGNIPHAILMEGPRGTGKLQSAISFAQYLLCHDPQETDSCGKCSSCFKTSKFIHPDLHFIFPIYKKRSEDKPLSDEFLDKWRTLLLSRDYFELEDWLEILEPDQKQVSIYVHDIDNINARLQLTSASGSYRAVIIWLPERMNESASNKLLKLLEEPPAKSLFMLVSETPDMLLDTIISRCRRISFKPLEQGTIAEHLTGNQFRLDRQLADNISHLAGGSWLGAIKQLESNQENQEFFDIFVQLMRLAYVRRIADLKTWTSSVSTRGREWQKRFLDYCQKQIRENFIYNFHLPQINYQTLQESNFSIKFAPFINERNVFGIMNEFELAQKHIGQNVSATMVFFDLSVKLIMLLKS
ncbi:MAG: DNA polymerase III subunit delta [Bacteroidaceae bacterium]|nr:DNA polymerase III subunit delta [Bacteroidaceae bacterium]